MNHILPSFLLLGNLYIADSGNQRIRKVIIATGIINTIAGTGTGGYSGDNDPATAAGLFYPTGVSIDSSGTTIFCLLILCPCPYFAYLGNVYIADESNNRIRKVTVGTTYTPRFSIILYSFFSLKTFINNVRNTSRFISSTE